MERMATALYKRNLYPSFLKVDVPHGKMMGSLRDECLLAFHIQKMPSGFRQDINLVYPLQSQSCVCNATLVALHYLSISSTNTPT